MAYTPNLPAQSLDRASLRRSVEKILAVLAVGAAILTSAAVMAHQPAPNVCIADIC